MRFIYNLLIIMIVTLLNHAFHFIRKHVYTILYRETKKLRNFLENDAICYVYIYILIY